MNQFGTSEPPSKKARPDDPNIGLALSDQGAGAAQQLPQGNPTGGAVDVPPQVNQDHLAGQIPPGDGMELGTSSGLLMQPGGPGDSVSAIIVGG
jgi:hypothetical protein